MRAWLLILIGIVLLGCTQPAPPPANDSVPPSVPTPPTGPSIPTVASEPSEIALHKSLIAESNLSSGGTEHWFHNSTLRIVGWLETASPDTALVRYSLINATVEWNVLAQYERRDSLGETVCTFRQRTASVGSAPLVALIESYNGNIFLSDPNAGSLFVTLTPDGQYTATSRFHVPANYTIESTCPASALVQPLALTYELPATGRFASLQDSFGGQLLLYNLGAPTLGGEDIDTVTGSPIEFNPLETTAPPESRPSWVVEWDFNLP